MKTLSQFMKESFQQDRSAGMRNVDGKRSKDDEKENANKSKFKLYKDRGWTFDPSIHASSQAQDRHPNTSYDDWKKVHRNVVDGIKKLKGAKNGDYLFFSKSADVGYVASVNFSRKVVRIVTVLPKSRGNAKPGTEKIMVESCEFYHDETWQVEHFVEVE